MGQIDVRLEVNKGKIDACTIYGDFFGVGDVQEVQEKLTGVRYEKASIEQALEDIDIPHYFGNITKEEFVELIY